MKRLLMAMILLLSIVAVPAMAATTSVSSVPFGFVGVEHDDHYIGSTTVEVVAGESVSFDVLVRGYTDVEDVKIRAWVNGYEYDDIEDRVGAFDMNDNVVYTKTLTLDIPNDMEAGDYELNFEVYTKDDSVERSFDLSVVNKEHEIEVQDVMYTENVDAGDNVDVYVRLENTGESKEDDIKVVVSVPELGVSVRGYVDELGAVENNSDDDETSGAIVLSFDVPADVPTGAYEMEVEVTYDNGYANTVEVYTLNVEGASADVDADSDADTTVVVVVEPDADVDADADTAEPADSITVSTNALKIGFGVLAALLVVLAIVFILRRE